MARVLCVSLVAMLVLGIVASVAFAQQKRPISKETFERMIQNQPLILEGNITEVNVRLMTPKELGGRNSTVHIAVTEVIMKIRKIVAGEYDGDEIRIVLPEGKTKDITTGPADYGIMKFNVGDHAVVALKLNSEGSGVNILDRGERIFRVEGSSLIPYREELYLAVDKPLEVMAKKAKERELPEIFKASDLVCTGTVTELRDLDSPLRRFIVSIDETLKGKAEKSEIAVEMSDIFLPSKLQAPGFRVMLFLKKQGTGYRPVAGVNGYYVMDGERLTRGHSTPVKTTASQLKSTIKMWKEVER
jgi:hypothetical protein